MLVQLRRWWQGEDEPTYPSLTKQLTRIERRLDIIEWRLGRIMATEAELLTLLAQANTQTNQIGQELQQLLDRPEVSQAVRDAAQGLVTRLTAVAAEVPTPVNPPPPPA